ncbi:MULTISPECIES: LuxR C-terminal-related transcriptional regulator [unclassified Streptomyces]|uniref:LuxR C-terminal-related transcriptional regulator n=1 Tax=unclassified Streptomyces TaxID=2593676 RepID=UPI0037FF581A
MTAVLLCAAGRHRRRPPRRDPYRRRPRIALSPLGVRSLTVRFLASPAEGARLGSPDVLAGLTAREGEVTARVAEGSSNEEIADKPTVSPLTVRRPRPPRQDGTRRPGPCAAGRHGLPVGSGPGARPPAGRAPRQRPAQLRSGETAARSACGGPAASTTHP